MAFLHIALKIRLFVRHKLFARIMAVSKKLCMKLANKIFLVNNNFFYKGIQQACVDSAKKLFLMESCICSAIHKNYAISKT